MQKDFTLPQQPPYKMIDKVIHYDIQNIRCSYKITDSNPLVENSYLTSEGMIECMAQVAAAKASIESEESGIGYLVLIRSFECNRKVVTGETIEPELKILHDVHPFKIFEAAIWLGDNKIAAGEIRTFDKS